MNLFHRSPATPRINPLTGLPEHPFLVRLSERILRLSAPEAFGLSYGLTIGLLAVDFLSGFEMGFTRFVLIPISILTWARGRAAGVTLAVAASACWALMATLGGGILTSQAMFVWNAVVRTGFFVASAVMLSALRDSLQEEMKLARTDFLTGVANRRFFMELATQEIKRARRYRRPFILAYADIDGFKAINDRFGHNQGDALLRLAAQTIRTNLREVDIVARLGGDEFAILLPETGAPSARDVMAKVQLGLSKAMRANAWPVTFSIGTVIFSFPPMSVDEMVKRADQLMYRVKKAGKNTIEYETIESLDRSLPGTPPPPSA